MRSGWWHWQSGFKAMHLSHDWLTMEPWETFFQSQWGKFKYWAEGQGLDPCPNIHTVVRVYDR
jgi:hypothetical protein